MSKSEEKRLAIQKGTPMVRVILGEGYLVSPVGMDYARWTENLVGLIPDKSKLNFHSLTAILQKMSLREHKGKKIRLIAEVLE